MTNTLITKYRPTDFDSIIGQDKTVKALERILEKGLSRTFLFHGPSGTGKTTLARIMADKVGCTRWDVREIDGATFTGIDAMRSITQTLAYKPIGGEVKAFIVDECHGLSKQAWQSLLKSLEEPPPWVYWFLCTTEIGKVPKNILTRCSCHEMRLVDEDLLLDLLSEVAKAEGLLKGSEGAGVLDLCSKEAGGSPRQALVNLAVCSAAKTRKEAAEILKTAGESPEAVDLARALVRGAGWSECRKLLDGLRDTNPESIRQVVRAYMTNVVLGQKSGKGPVRALAILDEFSEFMNSGDGISPIVLAVGRVTLGA